MKGYHSPLALNGRLWAGILLLGLGLGLFGCASPDDRGTEPGQLSPEFTLAVAGAQSGTTVAWDQLPGHPTVLSFWTIGCSYCRAQTPTLVDAFMRYGDQVRFIGINIQDDLQNVKKYARTYGIRYPLLLDSDGAVADRYNIRGYPTTYFLDTEGRVFATHLGQLSEEDLKGYVEQLLSLPDPAPATE